MRYEPGSYVSGHSEIPLLGETLPERLAKTVATWPDREALISRHQGIRWTWRQLGDRVDAFARGLVKIGLKPGERLGIWSPNKANGSWRSLRLRRPV